MLAPPTVLVRRVDALGVRWPAQRCWHVSLLAGAALALGTFVLGGPGATLVAFVVAAVGVAAAVDLYGDRADRLVDAELPAVIDAIADGVRSGLTLPVSVQAAAVHAHGPVSGDLQLVDRRLLGGEPLRSALDRWAHHRPTRGVRLTVAALTLAYELGGTTAPLDGVSSTLRDQAALARELRALSSQGRASAGVIIAAPFVLLAVLGASDASWWSFFTRSTLGLACLIGGVALDVLGAWWMARITRGPSWR